jgi:hypothetical protein
VPQPGLTRNEKRFAAACRLLAAIYGAGALALLVFRDALSPDPGPAVLVLAMMTAVAASCLAAAAHPRERRHAALPALVAPLTAVLVGAALLAARNAGVPASPALVWAVAAGLPLFAIAALAWRASAPGVRGPAAPEAPAAVEEPPRIQLKVSKR